MSRFNAALRTGAARNGVLKHRFSSVRRLRGASQCLPSSDTQDKNVSTSKVEEECALSNRKPAIQKTPQLGVVLPVFNDWLDGTTVPANLKDDIKDFGEALQKMISTPEGQECMRKSQNLMAKIGQTAGNVLEALKWGLDFAKDFALRNPGTAVVVLLIMAFTFITCLYKPEKLTKYGLSPAFSLIWQNIVPLLSIN